MSFLGAGGAGDVAVARVGAPLAVREGGETKERATSGQVIPIRAHHIQTLTQFMKKVFYHSTKLPHHMHTNLQYYVD